MDSGYSAWIGLPVVLQVVLGDIKVPLRGKLLKEAGDTVRMRIGDGWDVDIYKTRGQMIMNQVPKYVTQGRAALLLGIPEDELGRISNESGLGHTERAGDQIETFFTYEELRQICVLSTHPVN